VSHGIFVEMMRKVSFIIKEKMISSWVDYGMNQVPQTKSNSWFNTKA